MSETKKKPQAEPADVTPPVTEGNKGRSINEKLRKKLEKLKQDDPNIYPIF